MLFLRCSLFKFANLSTLFPHWQELSKVKHQGEAIIKNRKCPLITGWEYATIVQSNDRHKQKQGTLKMVTIEDLRNAMKFYHGEKENPFANESNNPLPNRSWLWEREEEIYHMMHEDLLRTYNEAVSNITADQVPSEFMEFDEAKKVLVFTVAVAIDNGYDVDNIRLIVDRYVD